MRFLKMAAGATVACGVALAQNAQTKPVEKVVEQDVVHVMAAPTGVVGHASTGTRVFMQSGGTVKGAPYSAETVTESVQTLADGNRISHKQTGKVYRDAEGRTRNDHSFAPLGAWVPDSSGGESVTMILDPVSGDSWTLNNTQKTAMKLPAMGTMKWTEKLPDGKVQDRKEVHVEMRGATAGTFNVEVPPPGGDAVFVRQTISDRGPEGSADVKKETLGKQVVEGVECEGTRITMTIAAGKMGNDRPIVSVTERWYSPALQVDVLRKHNDPRSGEMTYKLQRVSRSEQPKSLFEVPSDYKVEEAPKPNIIMRKVEKKD